MSFSQQKDCSNRSQRSLNSPPVLKICRSYSWIPKKRRLHRHLKPRPHRRLLRPLQQLHRLPVLQADLRESPDHRLCLRPERKRRLLRCLNLSLIRSLLHLPLYRAKCLHRLLLQNRLRRQAPQHQRDLLHRQHLRHPQHLRHRRDLQVLQLRPVQIIRPIKPVR